MPTSGGAYGYIDAAFGPLAGCVAGTLLWFGDVLGCGGIVAALADLVATRCPGALTRPVHALTIVIVTGGMALVNIAGVSRATRIISVATLLKLDPALLAGLREALLEDRTLSCLTDALTQQLNAVLDDRPQQRAARLAQREEVARKVAHLVAAISLGLQPRACWPHCRP